MIRMLDTQSAARAHQVGKRSVAVAIDDHPFERLPGMSALGVVPLLNSSAWRGPSTCVVLDTANIWQLSADVALVSTVQRAAASWSRGFRQRGG